MKIKGKEYKLVSERVEDFRKIYPDWTIESELLKFDQEVAVVKSFIKDPTGRIVSTGFAFEVAGSSLVNSTSHLENAETSAVGRALGFLGFGIANSIASAEEVMWAIQRQNQPNQQNKRKNY